MNLPVFSHNFPAVSWSSLLCFSGILPFCCQVSTTAGHLRCIYLFFGMKKGLEFIGDPQHKITEENIHQLYELTIGAFLPKEDRLLPGQKYRHSRIYIVSDKVEHTGLPWQLPPGYMGSLVDFINQESSIYDLLKAAPSTSIPLTCISGSTATAEWPI